MGLHRQYKFAGAALADMATSVDDETILEVLRSNDAPRMTTTEISSALPVTRGTTRTRLQRLADDDLLERKRESNHVVWWLPERADELDAAATPDNAAEADPDGDAPAGDDNAAEAEEPTGGDAEGESGIGAEVDDPDEAAATGDPAGGADDASREDDEAPDEDAEDHAIEVEPTEQREPDATAVEVDAAGSDDPDAALPEEAAPAADRTPDAETETRTAATAADDRDRTAPTPTGREPELSDDDEGLRALALVAGGLAALLLLRKLLGGDGDAT